MATGSEDLPHAKTQYRPVTFLNLRKMRLNSSPIIHAQKRHAFNL